MFVDYVIFNLLTSRKQEKKDYVFLPPASFKKANSQNGWNCSRRGVEFCVSLNLG